MRTRIFPALLLCVLTIAGALGATRAASAMPESRLMRFPDIAGDRIVFTYAGDLWTVPTSGGVATRLTSHPGIERFAKFSPDGKTIAFTASYDGNLDVYTLPVEGGMPTRLTYHPNIDFVLEWHPSGDKILFRSDRASETNAFPGNLKLFYIDAKGGFPEQLPFFEAGLTSFSPDGKRIAFNRYAQEFRTWKRYRGGWHQFIELYDFDKNTSEKLMDYEGIDAFPMWYGDRIYFISDRDHTMNIFCIDLKDRTVRKITNHDEYDVKWPSLGGDRIVYENGGWLFVLDLKTEKTAKISVEIPAEQLNVRPHFENVARLIRDGDISKTGKRAVFEARGDIFTVPAEKGEIKNLTRTSGIRERSPAYSPDSKWIAYLSDRTGDYEIYLRALDGTGEEVQLTKGNKCYQWDVRWSPDSKKLMYTDQTGTLYFLDIDAKAVQKVDKGEVDDINWYSWAPDSKWIAYAKVSDNYFGSIYLYSLADKKSYKVTSDAYDDYDPVFDPEGKYLYFCSNRSLFPQFGGFDNSFNHVLASDICAVTLKSDTPSPLAPQSDEEEKPKEEKEESADKKAGDEKKDEKKDGGTDAKDSEKKEDTEKPKDIAIDLAGLEGRIVALPVGPGSYGNLTAAQGKLYYMSFANDPVFGSEGAEDGGGGVLMAFDMKDREAKQVIAGIGAYAFSADRKKILYAAHNTYGIIDAGTDKKVGDGKLAIDGMQMMVDPQAEWRQMYHEAWRLERDFFYDPNMHGVDWEKIGKRYEALLPYIGHRDDLNYIMGELQAELCASHTYISGGDYPAVEAVNVGLLGCDFEVDKASGLYRFKTIYPGRNWDKSFIAPLNQPGINVKPGDYLFAVNGVELEAPTNVYALFQNLAEKQTVLKVGPNASGKDSRECTVEPVAYEGYLRYDAWVEGNRKKVDEATNDRIGYIHVPNTSIFGFNEFTRSFYSLGPKDGIIVDVRYNQGGQFPDIMIERLGRRLLNMWGRREYKSWRTPSSAPMGPMVCIINGLAGSGGDAFPYYFRERKLGPLVGMTTWGGLIGYSRGIPLMDGGRITMPDFGIYNMRGEWDVERIGVKPDIEVDNLPNEMVAGRDPQLEKAIEAVKAIIAKEKPSLPPKPKYPIRK